MKTIFTISLLFTSLFSLNSFAENIITSEERVIVSHSDVGNVYPLTARTEKGYGQEYAIGIEVHSAPYSNSISKVVVEGRSVRFNIDYSESNKYSFSYGTELYYFYFKPQ